MSKQLHTVFIVPAQEKHSPHLLEDINSRQHLQEIMTEMKSYWQEASADLLQPRKEVMQRLFSTSLSQK